MNSIYLDNNATTKTLPEVNDVISRSLSYYGNPSSNHDLGQETRDLIFDARENVKSLISSENHEIVFTSSGTESNNTVLTTFANDFSKNIVTSRIEHSSILKFCEKLEVDGYEVRYVPVKSDGIIDLETLKKLVDKNTALVSIQWVNNETGVIQPIHKVLDICNKNNVPFHTDASQAIGKLEIDLDNIDYLTFTGHKIHAPKGVGVILKNSNSHLSKQIFGGPQENSFRAGTENVLGILGLGEACRVRRVSLNDSIQIMSQLRDQFEMRLLSKLEDIKINGDVNSRVCNTSNIMFKGIDGQALISSLSANGLYCSQSSACTNMTPEPSYVLTNMGLDHEEAFSSVRFSFSVLNTSDEVKQAVELITDNVNKLRKFSALWSTN